MQKDIYKSDYHYEIPDKLIARYPLKKRTDSKLLSCNKSFNIHDFSSLPSLLKKDDLIVFNETKVFKARLILQKESGSKAEIFVNKIISKFEAECLTKGLNLKKKVQILKSSTFPIKITIYEKQNNSVLIKFNQEIKNLCESIGKVPIPPYLDREEEEIDKKRYQSVFAKESKNESAAAPTASLHFDDNLYEKIKTDFDTCVINLSVGLGTFKPLSDEPINNLSKLHEENFYISKNTSEIINDHIKNKKRVVAIGTTTLRALESAWDSDSQIILHGNQSTDIFIKEGFKFNVANALITNFHLPQSSLLMLVSAFAGKELIFSAYKYAIEKKLRFFSYGDAMIIER
ncbi:tRNA preQ1(34) S-adenosylmethionine ribosyltransferase-isomerase QueA [Gammaproteobacteria bacterium]|nr:tRNA preQ1(34) S-adenosylmethionine ribosyltransferase-isomerase QueA [Gammaproteobacteria bacterium]